MTKDDDISGNTKGTVRKLELLLAEVFGVDGNAGRFQALEETVKQHSADLAILKTNDTKLGVVKYLVMMAGGVLAALVIKFIDKLL